MLTQVNASVRYPKRLTPKALIRLENYDWPGNIRELGNVIERSALLCRKQAIDADDLMISSLGGKQDSLTTLPDPHEGFMLDDYLQSVRKQLLLRALELSQGNQSEAGRLLGISPQAVHKFVKNMSKD